MQLWIKMRIAEGLDVLELKANGGIFRPTLIWDKDNVVLVDTGLPGQLQNIREEMERAGVAFDRLDKVIITHQDTDHVGSLSSIIRETNNGVEVLSHEDEKPYIQWDKRPIKMTPERMAQLEEQMNSLPEDKRREMKEAYSNLKAEVNTTLKDGEELPWCGGIRVIHTPGHTPGHICLYLKKYRALITGDAMNVVEGKLVGPMPHFTYDMNKAINSLKKLTEYDIETVICYHGGVFKDNLMERIKEIYEGK